MADQLTKFQMIDDTMGQSFDQSGDNYNGPVTGVDWQWVVPDNIIAANLGIDPADNLDITADVPNVFMKGGAGDDALDASKVAGTNVLDGGTGSNFLRGGSGHDTFFLDDRNASCSIWSTVANLQSGDTATIWTPPEFQIATLTPSDFEMPRSAPPQGVNVTTSDGQGAPNFTGLTIGITAPDKPDANLTLVGYSTADLISGRLTIAFGRTPDTTVPGSDFLLVKAT